MFDIELKEIGRGINIQKLNLQETDCIIFFHFKHEDVIQDYQFMKDFENIYNYNVNWIDCEKLYNSFIDLNIRLKLIDDINATDTNIKSLIKEHIISQLIRTKKYYYKGDYNYAE